VRRVAAVACAILAGCGPSATVSPAPKTFAPLPAARVARAPAPFVVHNQHHRLYKNLRIASAVDCMDLTDSTDITIENSQIGPCGGNGIAVSGGGTIRIYDSYIHVETRSHGCCDRNDGVLLQHTSDITIAGNVIAYGESNVEAPQGVARLTIEGNFLLNPRGPFPRGQNVQAWHSHDVVVRNNYALSSTDTTRFLYPDDQEDSINFGIGSGFVAEGNYVTGGHSPSGCGIIADDGAGGARFSGNRLVDTGGCGIAIASGANQSVTDNRILNRTPVRGAGNTALYVWNQYPSPCGPVIVEGNVATEVRANGVQSGYWDGGGCGKVAVSHNTWNAAALALLTPVDAKLPPPLVPPVPHLCVARSPYSTQTSVPACGD